MKMKELNFYLSVIGFIQLVVLACTGAVVNEFMKEDRSVSLIVVSIMVDVITASIGIAIYLRVFKKISESDE